MIYPDICINNNINSNNNIIVIITIIIIIIINIEVSTMGKVLQRGTNRYGLPEDEMYGLNRSVFLVNPNS